MENETDIYTCPTDGKKFKIVPSNGILTTCSVCAFSNADGERCYKNGTICAYKHCYYEELPETEKQK